METVISEVELADWVRQGWNPITCVYCNQLIPGGSPQDVVRIVAEHSKVCAKHPMRKLEKENEELKERFFGFAATSDSES